MRQEGPRLASMHAPMRQERPPLAWMHAPMRQEGPLLASRNALMRQARQSVSTSTRAPSALSVATNFG
jgi:hypothetical protein